MPRPRVLVAEVHAVRRVHPVHELVDIPPRRLDQQMIMIRHQAIRI